MATLTETAVVARKAIRYTIYGLIFLIFARVVFNIGSSIYRTIFPPPPPAPTVTFGKLPTIPFPFKESPPNLSYTLETPDGKFPAIKEQLNVYYIPTVSSNFGTLDRAKEQVSQLGFLPEGRLVVENVPNVYEFPRKNSPSKLTMNIATGVFSISYDIASDPSVLGTLPPDAETAKKTAEGFLMRGEFPFEDLTGPTKVHYFAVQNGQLQTAISQSEADFTKINFYRKEYEEGIPTVTPDIQESNVWFMISGSRERDKQIVVAEYHYFPLDTEKKGTYPLITSEEAWEKLKSGKGYVVSVGANPSGNIVIRRIYLAYFDPNQYTEFLQPVVVLEGDGGFVAYIPAIQDKFYGSEEETTQTQ